MIGEGLLAPWLRELEFRDVVVPSRQENDTQDQWLLVPDNEVSQLGVLFKEKDIAHTIRTTLEAFEQTFLVATMTRGVVDRPETEERWTKIDLFRDIEQCATERCRCLG